MNNTCQPFGLILSCNKVLMVDPILLKGQQQNYQLMKLSNVSFLQVFGRSEESSQLRDKKGVMINYQPKLHALFLLGEISRNLPLDHRFAFFDPTPQNGSHFLFIPAVASLKLTAKAPENTPFQKETIVFQPSPQNGSFSLQHDPSLQVIMFPVRFPHQSWLPVMEVFDSKALKNDNCERICILSTFFVEQNLCIKVYIYIYVKLDQFPKLRGGKFPKNIFKHFPTIERFYDNPIQIHIIPT